MDFDPIRAPQARMIDAGIKLLCMVYLCSVWMIPYFNFQRAARSHIGNPKTRINMRRRMTCIKKGLYWEWCRAIGQANTKLVNGNIYWMNRTSFEVVGLHSRTYWRQLTLKENFRGAYQRHEHDWEEDRCNDETRPATFMRNITKIALPN